MNYYETLYIIHSALDSGRIKEMVLSVNKTLEKNGGKIICLDIWGKKKLAYEIDKQKYGTYILVQFSGDGSGNSKLNIELEHNPNVLAYLTLKIHENKIHEQTLSLDEQIRGDQPSQSPPLKDSNLSSEKETAKESSPEDEQPAAKEDVSTDTEETAVNVNNNEENGEE